jgi:hypothetical protein
MAASDSGLFKRWKLDAKLSTGKWERYVSVNLTDGILLMSLKATLIENDDHHRMTMKILQVMYSHVSVISVLQSCRSLHAPGAEVGSTPEW